MVENSKNIGIDNYVASNNVVAHKVSNTVAIVDVGNKTLKEFSIPQGSKLKLHLVMIAYFNSVACKKLSVAYRKNIVLASEKLLDFIEREGYQQDQDVPLTVFEKFTTYLKQNTSKIGYTVKDALNKVKLPIEWAIKNPKMLGLTDTDILTFRQYILRIPHIPKGRNKKKPPLSALFEDCPFSDTQLIKSLRLVSCWTLLEYERHRNLLLQQPNIRSLLRKLAGRDITLPPMDYGTWAGKKSQANLEIECRTLYGELVQSILSIGDDVLTERLLSSINMPFEFPLSDHEWQLMISKLITNTGQVTAQYRYNKVAYNVQSIISLTFRGLIAPSHVEVFAAQCFFASDRLQTSNLERLKISDIASNARATQTRHTKIRRVRRKNNTTPVYPKNSLISDSIASYIKVIENCQSFLPDADKEMVFPYVTSTHLKVGDIGRGKNSLTMFYELLIKNGTVTQLELFRDISEEDAKPILWIIKKVYENNLIVKEEEAKYTAILNAEKKAKSPKKVFRNCIVKTERISLNPTYIGESRVAMKGGETTWIKGNKNVVPNPVDSFVDAELTAHTEQTKKNIYSDRTLSKEEQSNRTSFAEQVANLMEKDALKMNALASDTKVVDLDKAKKLLGCASGVSTFQELAENSDEDIGLTGEINSGGVTIFVENELTAALLIKRINHIENQLPILLVDDPELQTKALQAVQHLVYLKEVLNKYSEVVKAQGRKLSDELVFTFSEMI